MDRLLLTGATGFAGRHALARLAAEQEVWAVVRPGATRPGVPGVHWLEADLGLGFSTDDWPRRVDAVLHLAQSRHYREFPEKADDILAVNVDATLRLLEYARRAGAARFVHVSTGGVYAPQRGRIDETAPLAPRDFYAATKEMAEALVRRYSRIFATTVLRPFFIYGPAQAGMLVPRLLDRLLSGEAITIAGDPGIRTNPTFVSDFVGAAVQALRSSATGAFNVAGAETVSIRELVERLGRAAGREPIIRAGPADVEGDLVPDARRMMHDLGYSCRVPLARGLAETVASRTVAVPR